MEGQNALKWNKRLSGVYALGVWTMVCCYGYLRYSGRLDDTDWKVKQVPEEENPNQVTYESKYHKGIVIYKKDFVPYTTRISNFIASFSGDAAKDAGNATSDNK